MAKDLPIADVVSWDVQFSFIVQYAAAPTGME